MVVISYLCVLVRKSQQHLWEKAVKFLSENESRVREETHEIEGEEFHAWRWIQVRTASQLLQKSAFK